MIKAFLKKLNRRLEFWLNDNNFDYKVNFRRISHSQCGEDLIVEYLLNLKGVTKPTFLDVGAHHPVYLNNTLIFYNNGARGVNIEANKSLIKDFNNFRPDDINLNIGVGVESEIKNFYIFEDATLSTFSKVESDNFLTLGQKLKEVVQVSVMPLNEIFSTYFKDKSPDLLFLDIEGLDFDIIKTIDFKKNRPLIICVESHFYDPKGMGAKNIEMCKYLFENDYYEYSDTGLNSIFIDRLNW